MIIQMLGEDLNLPEGDFYLSRDNFIVELNDELLEKGICKIESVNGCDSFLLFLIDIEYAQRRAKEIITAMKEVAKLERDASRMEFDI